MNGANVRGSHSGSGEPTRTDGKDSDDRTTFVPSRRRLLRRSATVGGVGLLAGCLDGVFGSETYTNPVYGPILADPSVLRADGAYYAYGTQDASPAWDCTDAAMAILRSESLTDWEYVGEVLAAWPDWKDDGFLWAPDVARYDGRYYAYYSYSEWGDENPGIGVATAESPEGPFEDHGKLFLSSDIGVGNSIDPQLFVEQGTPYLVWGSWHGIHGVELTDDGLDWKPETTFPLAGEAYEAPYVIERDGSYYLFVSTGSCCEGHASTYEVEVGRSESFFGPYRDQRGVDLREIDRRNAGEAILTGNDRFSAPGHNAVVTDEEGTDWICYHAYDREEAEFECGSAPRRSMLLDELRWEGGYPTVEGRTPAESHDVPST